MDEKLQKRVEKDTTGSWRHRRRPGDILSDEDYSDDEYGKSRGRQAHQKKRKLVGADGLELAGEPITLSDC